MKKLWSLLAGLCILMVISGCGDSSAGASTGVGERSSTVGEGIRNGSSTSNNDENDPADIDDLDPDSLGSTNSGTGVVNEQKDNDDPDNAGSQPNKNQPSDLAIEDREIYEIQERMFILMCEDVHQNPEDYADKLVKLEGFYYEYTYDTGETRQFVLRFGPACCSDDISVGFEVSYDGGDLERDDWVEVYGIPVVKERDGGTYVELQLVEVNILDERGTDQVFS